MALLHKNASSWNQKTVLFIHGIGFQPALYSEPLYQIFKASDSAVTDATRWYEVVYDQANTELKAKVVELQKRIPPAGSPPGAQDLAADFLVDLVDYLATNSLYNWINNFVRKALMEVLTAGIDDGVLPVNHQLILISHSLGTVVAYEVLHSIIDDPQLPGLSSGVRAQAWLTMGSPLAFIKARQAQIPSLNNDFFLRRQPIVLPTVNDPFRDKPQSNVVNWLNFRQKYDPVGSLVPLDQATSNNSLTKETFVFDKFHAGVNPHDFVNYITEYKNVVLDLLRA